MQIIEPNRVEVLRNLAKNDKHARGTVNFSSCGARLPSDDQLDLDHLLIYLLNAWSTLKPFRFKLFIRYL
jgi:hypothetical protein